MEMYPGDSAATTVLAPVITGERLSMETLVVSVQPIMPADQADPMNRLVLELCKRSHSVAEIAGRLQLSVSHAASLISSLAQRRAVLVYPQESVLDGPSMALMLRVLEGLRNL
ncbi:DUF742 domain-containing protein [Pseudonocardiaceae bacterium YIM PH 21723]|nr:DUF742 domain-containing protein [Pseudonocardiaceae bacterium YIM PH 21723]